MCRITTAQIQDGGDAYSVPPKWVPFRRFLGYWGSVVLGRWIGGLLGYKPFFREYTTDWDYAVAKMKRSWFQRHLAEDAYAKARPWGEQVALDHGRKPLNAEYEPMTTDLTALSNGKTGGHVLDIVAARGNEVTAPDGLRSRMQRNGTAATATE